MATSPAAGKPLFVAVDVHYLQESRARAAIVIAGDRRFLAIARTDTAVVPAEGDYRPGEFDWRELPPLQAVIPRWFAKMAGPFRLPDALKLADRLARGLELPRARDDDELPARREPKLLRPAEEKT